MQFCNMALINEEAFRYPLFFVINDAYNKLTNF